MRLPTTLVAARHASPLGGILLAATPHGLAGLWFEGQRYHPDIRHWRFDPSDALLRRAMAQLDEYFAGTRTRFELPLDLQGGTPFQQDVWRALLSIPCGQRTSYGELSRRIGRPEAARAVGAAVGRNPVSVVVPCHRVLGADGSLTGYAGGLDRKTALLRLESQAG
jgi:methylated-DNA-[protein]-cysteine S-methyltransferase